MHAWSSYLPRLVRCRLASGPFGDVSTPRVERGAVLFADLQGSTAAIERAAASGTVGLEALSASLNQVFCTVIDDVYAFGGDVLFITGDGFLAWWPAGHGPLDSATESAAAAALEIQRGLREASVRAGDRWRMRVGVGAGSLASAFVGGHGGRWHLVVAGEALEQAKDAETISTPGQVRLSPAAWSLVRDSVDGVGDAHGAVVRRTRGPAEARPAPEPDLELTDAQLGAYVPAAVAQWREGSTPAWLTEFRRVTAWIVDLPSLPLDIGERLEDIHSSVAAFQSVAAKYGGSAEVHVDDKGIMLLAVFGLAPRAHEDDAKRAVLAAWEHQQKAAKAGSPYRAGIASGLALCAPMGNDLRREYVVFGGVIARAARLMKATASEIVCDEESQRATRHAIMFEELPKHLLKGIDTLSVYRAAGVLTPGKRSFRPLVGRDAQLRLFDAHLQALLTEGRPATLVIQGDAGIGKSSVLTLFAHHANAAGTRVVRAHGDEIERGTPYYPWQPVFSELFGLVDGMDTTTRRRRVVEEMRRFPDAAPLMPLLSLVLRVPIEDSELTSSMGGDVRAENIRALLTLLMEDAASAGPSVLLVDDAHWFDSRSWELLVEMSNRGIPLLIVVAGRRAEEHPQNWSALQRAETVRLPEFGRTETEVLLSRRLGTTHLPTEFVDAVVARAGGNPFFCEQTVQAMIENGHITVERGVCLLHHLGEFPIPQTVTGLIQTRFDLLDSNERKLLKSVSIAGLSCPSSLLAEIAPAEMTEAQVERAAEGLVRAGFLDRATEHDGPTYSFRHFLTREVTYASLSGTLRSEGHGRVARWLEASRDAVQPTAAVLAHHWLAAGDNDRALGYLEQAGEQALRSGSFVEAVTLYRRACEIGQRLGIESESVRSATWFRGLGAAHYFCGAMADSRLNLERTIAILDRPLPPPGVNWWRGLRLFQNVTRELLMQIGRRWRPHTQRAHTGDVSAAHDRVVDSYRMLAQVYFLERRGPGFLLYTTLRGLNVGEASGPSNALARTLANMSVLARLLGLEGWSEWYRRRAVAMTEEGGQRAAAPYVWHVDAIRQAQHGAWSRALASNQRATDLMAAIGDATHANDAIAVRSAITLCMGDVANAIATVERACQLASDRRNQQYLCWALLDEVEIGLALDDMPRAAQKLEEALRIETEPTDLGSAMDKCRATALLRTREGRYDDAIAAAEQVCTLFAVERPTSYYVVDFYASAVETFVAALEAGRTSAAIVASTEKHLRSLRRLSGTFWNVAPRYWLLKGRAEQALGRDARAAFERSLAIAVQREMTFDEARARAALARFGGDAYGHLERAKAIFIELGALHELHGLGAMQAAVA